MTSQRRRCTRWSPPSSSCSSAASRCQMPRARWLPGCRPGRSPVADYPTVLLSGSWLSQGADRGGQRVRPLHAQARATGEAGQSRFPCQRRQTAEQPRHQFRGAAPTLSVGDDAMRATLADAMSAPSNGVAATIMLDQSLPTDDGGKTRLANVIAALGRPDQGAAAQLGRGAVDVRRPRGSIRGGDRAAGRPGQRPAALGGAAGRAGQAVFIERRCGVVHHAANASTRTCWPITVPAKRIRCW